MSLRSSRLDDIVKRIFFQNALAAVCPGDGEPAVRACRIRCDRFGFVFGFINAENSSLERLLRPSADLGEIISCRGIFICEDYIRCLFFGDRSLIDSDRIRTDHSLAGDRTAVRIDRIGRLHQNIVGKAKAVQTAFILFCHSVEAGCKGELAAVVGSFFR